MQPAAAVDKSLLLKNLAIDRGVIRAPAKWPVNLVVASLVGLVLVSAGYFWFSHTAVVDNDPVIQLKVEPVTTATTAILPATQTLPVPGVVEQSVLDATGYVVARQAATVSSKTTGKISEVLIEEGMAVQQGQIIARLDDSAVQAQLDLALAQLEATKAARRELGAQTSSAQLNFERGVALVEKQLVSQSRLDTLKAELDTLLARSETAIRAIEVSKRRVAVHRVALDDLVIRAPFTGIVISKSAQPGEMISPVSAGGGFTRTGIGTIVDMDSLEVEVDVNEAYINRVHHDQAVSIKLNAYPEHMYEGRVLAVIPTADRNKATIRVRVRFLSPDQRVLPEMGVRVAFLER